MDILYVSNVPLNLYRIWMIDDELVNGGGKVIQVSLNFDQLEEILNIFLYFETIN